MGQNTSAPRSTTCCHIGFRTLLREERFSTGLGWFAGIRGLLFGLRLSLQLRRAPVRQRLLLVLRLSLRVRVRHSLVFLLLEREVVSSGYSPPLVNHRFGRGGWGLLLLVNVLHSLRPVPVVHGLRLVLGKHRLLPVVLIRLGVVVIRLGLRVVPRLRGLWYNPWYTLEYPISF